MKWTAEFFKGCMAFIVGWFKIITHKNNNYSCVIEGISLNQAGLKPTAMIRYKIIGCRTPMFDSPNSLNNSHVFSLFKPDHAQIIVSMATVESLLAKTSDEINRKYLEYVSYCALKINETKQV